MLHLRTYAAADSTEAAQKMLFADPAVSGLAVLRGATIKPPRETSCSQMSRGKPPTTSSIN